MVILEADGFGWSLSLARGVMNPANAALHIVITFLVSFPDHFLDRRGPFCVELIYLEESSGEESPRMRRRYLAGMLFRSLTSRAPKCNLAVCCVFVLLSLST